MLVVNLAAPPGSGKSTGAAYIFSKLKMNGVNAEYVPEVAKDEVWEGNNKALQNQAYLFGNQYFRLSRLDGEVDVAVTDSPLILTLLYNNDKRLGEDFNKAAMNVSNSFEQLNYFIRRVKPYNPKGRLQTEEESNALTRKIKDLMDKHCPNYEEVDGNQLGYDKIVSRILDYLEVKKLKAA